MESNEAKIRAFFGNSENLKALASNREFMEKIAGGQATPELYAKELEKMGLDVTPEEAREIQMSTQRAMETSPEELDNFVLENVGGGGEGAWLGLTVGAGVVGGAAGLAASGCSIAGVVYQCQAQSALNRGDLETGKKLNGRSLKLLGASTGLVLLGAGFGKLAGFGSKHLLKKDGTETVE